MLLKLHFEANIYYNDMSELNILQLPMVHLDMTARKLYL